VTTAFKPEGRPVTLGKIGPEATPPVSVNPTLPAVSPGNVFSEELASVRASGLGGVLLAVPDPPQPTRATSKAEADII
jgi:hypothetical protein